MNDKQQKILSEILDINWNMVREEDKAKKYALIEKIGVKTNELKTDMGEEAYNKFFN